MDSFLISGFSVFTDTKFVRLKTVFKDILMLKATNKKRGIITPRFKNVHFETLLPESQSIVLSQQPGRKLCLISTLTPD